MVIAGGWNSLTDTNLNDKLVNQTVDKLILEPVEPSNIYVFSANNRSSKRKIMFQVNTLNFEIVFVISGIFFKKKPRKALFS